MCSQLKIKIKHLLLVLTLSFCAFSSISQTYNFRNYSVEHGLPFIQVYTIFQDSKGNLWCGGYGGLSKFNGKTFVNYSPKNGLANHWVTSIAEDKKGNLWVGTIDGISFFDGKKFTTLTQENGLCGNYINALYYSSENILWVATNNGVCSFNGTNFTSYKTTLNSQNSPALSLMEDDKKNMWVGTRNGLFTYGNGAFKPATFSSELCNNEITALYQDIEKNIWIGTKNGLCIFNGSQLKSYSIKDGLPGNYITSIAQDKKNNIWIASPQGLSKFQKKQKENIFIQYQIAKDENSNALGPLFLDYEGNLWIGSYSGLFKYRSDDFITYEESDGLTNSFVFQTFRDKDGFLWTSTANGVRKFDGKKIIPYTTANGLVNNKVYSAIQDKSGTIWFGTEGGLSKFQNNSFTNYTTQNGLLSNIIYCLLQSSEGTLWIGGQGGVTLLKNNKFTSLEIDDKDALINSIFEDKSGTIWLGAYQGGLYKYNKKTQAIEEYKKIEGLKSNAFMSILQDSQGSMYFGTFDGVFIYNPSPSLNAEEDYLVRFEEKDGLSSDLVYLMTFDNNENTLWIGTNQGLNKLNLGEYKRSGKKIIEVYSKTEGFSGVECNTNAAYHDEDGSIWFGTVNGLVKYNPFEYIPNRIEPKTNITGFKIFYKDTALNPNIRLPYHLNNISFDFIGISLTNPEKVAYQYKLDGFDKNWSPVTKNNFASFSNLPPGRYTFKVKSANNEGVWNKTPTQFSFVITAPFWKTAWFWILVSSIAALIFIIGVRLRIKQVRERERQRLTHQITIATNELIALRAQMNPHFIFNSLNSIQHFILNSDQDAASRYLNKFARLIRTILHNTEKATVSITEEVESLRLYIELEALRFDNKFEYTIEIPEDIDPDYFELPTMLIQPYVENAILHGLNPKQGKGHLLIRFALNETHIICTIQDNGIGRGASKKVKQQSGSSSHKSMGMKITRDRLETLNMLHNFTLSVKITDLKTENGSAAGTKVDIFIPVT